MKRPSEEWELGAQLNTSLRYERIVEYVHNCEGRDQVERIDFRGLQNDVGGTRRHR